MLIFIYGKETYLVFERYLRLKEAFTEKNPSAHLSEFDLSEQFDSKNIVESLESGGGLFAEKKLVVFKDVFMLSVSNQKILIEALKNSNASKDDSLVVLIVEVHSKSLKGGLLKYLKKHAKQEEQKTLKLPQLRNWIRKRLEEQSKKAAIDEHALERLIQLTGGNLWQIKNEIDKLSNYKKDESINEDDIDLLCRGKTNAKIFDLIDAIGQNDKAQALKLKFQLISQGENEFFVFTMIVSQIRNLIKIDECMKMGTFDQERIAKQLSMHPFVVKKSIGQLRNFSKKRLKSIYRLAADQDYACKQGEQNMAEALDYMIAKI